MKAKMNNFSTWIKYVDEKKLAQEMENELVNSGFHIVDKCEHYFKPQGYTGLWLLSESHFAIHSFPEEDRIYLELSSCVDEPFLKMRNYIVTSHPCCFCNKPSNIRIM